MLTAVKNNIDCFFFFSYPTRYLNEDKKTPFLYMGSNKSVTPEAKMQVLMLQVDEEKISTKRPVVQQNAGFVVDRSKLKKKED